MTGLEMIDLDPSKIWVLHERTNAGSVSVFAEGETKPAHIGLRLHLVPITDMEGESTELYVALSGERCEQLVNMLVNAYANTLATNRPPPTDVVDGP